MSMRKRTCKWWARSYRRRTWTTTARRTSAWDAAIGSSCAHSASTNSIGRGWRTAYPTRYIGRTSTVNCPWRTLIGSIFDPYIPLFPLFFFVTEQRCCFFPGSKDTVMHIDLFVEKYFEVWIKLHLKQNVFNFYIEKTRDSIWDGSWVVQRSLVVQAQSVLDFRMLKISVGKRSGPVHFGPDLN